MKPLGEALLGASLTAALLAGNGLRLASREPVSVLEVAEGPSLPVAAATAAVRTRLSGGPETRLLIGSAAEVVVADLELRPLARVAGIFSSVATGDLDGDGGQEVLTAEAGATRPLLRARGADLMPRWSAWLPMTAPPSRIVVADLDGNGRGEVVAGNDRGELCATSSEGTPLWSWSFPTARTGEDAELRGLDDVATPGASLVAAARRSGEVAVLGSGGILRGSLTLESKLRRLRAFDLDGDGAGELLVGAEDGWLRAYDPQGGSKGAWRLLPSAITEIRPVEADHDPKTREALTGDKRGNVALLRGGTSVRVVSGGSKVSALLGADVDGDGVDELFVGGEDGTLTEVDTGGRVLLRQGADGPIERLVELRRDVGQPLTLLVAGGDRVRSLRIAMVAEGLGRRAWSPVLPAAALAFVILLLRPGVPTRPTGPVSAADAGRQRIEEWVKAGKAGADDARQRLAEIEAEARRAAPVASEALSPPPPSPPPPPKKKPGSR